MPDKKLIFSQQEIAGRVKELGRQITRDYTGKKMVAVGILNGAFIFLADLVRAIELPLEIDFIRVASYGACAVSSGNINFTKDLELPIKDRDVLLVEDIIDSGRTIACLKQHLAALGPTSLKICALIDKKERREVEVVVDYRGFELTKGFLVGYGLDYAEQHRHYPAIYHLLAPEK